jgi:hypothetical protein
VNLAGFIARVAFFTAVLALGLSEAGRAGTMTLYSCHTPSGRSVAADGWAPYGNGTSDRCASGPDGTLKAEFTSDADKSTRGWQLAVAPDTTVERFTAQICGRVANQGPANEADIQEYAETGFSTLRAAMSSRPQIGCVGPRPYCCDPENLASGGGARVRLVRSRLYCSSQCVGAVSAEISGFRADIGDYEPPAASAVRGSLATSATQVADETLEFDASDRGVGVFRAVAEARINRAGEWHEIVSAPVDPGGRCTPVRETSYLYEFAAPQPCPTTVAAARLELGVGALPSGTHTLRVRLEDAAGNSKLLVEPRAFSVPSPPETVAPPGMGDAGSAVLPSPVPLAVRGVVIPGPSGRMSITGPRVRALRTSRSFRIAGRLLDAAGKPLSGAAVLIQSRGFFPKSQTGGGYWTSLGSTTTDRDGVFRARIPAGPSRSIKVTYGYGASATVAQADFTVPAAIELHADRTHVRNGSSGVFKGRVAGPIPSGGVFVALEVREPNRWVPVATTRRWVKTSSTGTFTLAYRFLRTFQPATYRFRVVADEDSAFQYRRGTSRAINFHVRP